MTSKAIDIDFIKDWLEHGEIKTLAEEYGIDPSTGYLVLRRHGKKNFGFLELCYKRALERANKFVAFEQQKNIMIEKRTQLQSL